MKRFGASVLMWVVMLGGGGVAHAQYIPTACDMVAGREQYGTLTVGAPVVLGRHSVWRGETNWDEAMQRFVGMSASITQLAGVDDVGCPGIRVNVDGGQYFWRIRDLRLPSTYAPPPPPPQIVMPPPSGDPIPRACGLPQGRESYGAVQVGSAIVLGRHTPWSGDENWSPEMARFVGATATVTQLAGVDDVGCPTVRVNVDGGQWAWRIRDAQLVGSPVGVYPPPRVPAAIPAFCGQPAGQETYGPISVGSWVVLGAHTPWNGDANWSDEMASFVGQRAIVTELAGGDTSGCPGVRVNIDRGQHFWRIRDLRM